MTKALRIDSWKPRKVTVCALLDISRADIEAMGGVIESVVDEHAEVSVAVFFLDSGRLVSLVRISGDSAPGFSLLLDREGRPVEALHEFLAEARLDASAVMSVNSGE
ncbi:hypothetical protein [Kitasatospora sp. NPDC094011]|uniref:hypothetical protein n=1 Tax=Kitasatospora sp. NPDC094011 TaxID=3364090 RepID=UPI0037F2435B